MCGFRWYQCVLELARRLCSCLSSLVWAHYLWALCVAVWDCMQKMISAVEIVCVPISGFCGSQCVVDLPRSLVLVSPHLRGPITCGPFGAGMFGTVCEEGYMQLVSCGSQYVAFVGLSVWWTWSKGTCSCLSLFA